MAAPGELRLPAVEGKEQRPCDDDPGCTGRLHRLRRVRRCCPAKSKEVVKHKAINMRPKDEHLERERITWSTS